MKILVTGASGFVGSAVCSAVASAGHECTAVVRKIELQDGPSAGSKVAVGDINADTKWTKALAGVDVIIHCAARAHIMRDDSTDPSSDFRTVNVEGTTNLARQAAESGVKRFIFISSIKVNGEFTRFGEKFDANNIPAPEDAYGISKMEAESSLSEVSEEMGMEAVIIRPTLVYGNGVKGNFASLLGMVRKAFPMPFGAIHNRRSLVGLDNLVNLIITCIDHPNAGNEVFLVSDGEDVSTTQLLKRVAAAMGRPSRLIPVPAVLLKLAAIMVGKRAMAQRLLGSLQVDITKTREVLGWNPPVRLDEGLRQCVDNTASRRTS